MTDEFTANGSLTALFEPLFQHLTKRVCDTAGRMHYIEYLCGLVWKHKLDPVAISDAADLRQEMRRHGKRVRIQRVRESDEKYTAALRRVNRGGKSM